MAFASPQITAVAVEATEFPDLARKYHVTGVPKTVVNDRVEILGAVPQDAFVPGVMAALSEPSARAEQPEGRA
jgi:predicted DsbA family dithiol-disulfide isomerase